MGWYAEVVFFLLLRYTTTAMSFNMNLPQNLNEEAAYQNVDNIETDEPVALINEIEDAKLQHLGRLLANILVQPWPKGVSPILYMENIPPQNVQEETPVVADISDDNTDIPYKRSRYDAENRYLCQPSKEDVFRLLVALHEARQGIRGQTINFCNRRRTASAVFTNIRFLG